jgi:hypothetical protein
VVLHRNERWSVEVQREDLEQDVDHRVIGLVENRVIDIAGFEKEIAWPCCDHDAKSAFASCGHAAALALGGNVPILLQKSLMVLRNGDSVVVMRFAREASDDGAARSRPRGAVLFVSS